MNTAKGPETDLRHAFEVGVVVNQALDVAEEIDRAHALAQVADSELPIDGKLEATDILQQVTPSIDELAARAAKRAMVIAEAQREFIANLAGKYTISAVRAYKATRRYAG